MAKPMFRGRFEWLSALPLLLVTGALAVMALGALTGAQSPDARSREVLFSYFQRLSPATYEPGENFHLVMIDRESVDAIGPWPWPRTVLANLVAAAGEAGAASVILTEPVDAPDPLSPETIGEFWLAGASDDALAQQLARLPRTDEALANAFENVDGAFGVALAPGVNALRSNNFQRTQIEDGGWLSLDGESNYVALPVAQYFYALNDMLAASAQPAVAAIPLDSDGILRRLPLLWSLDDRPAPSLALEAARLANGTTVSAQPVGSSATSQGQLLASLNLGDQSIALSPTGAMRLHLPKRLIIPTTSASSLLNSSNTNSQLSGSVVLIGLDADLGDGVMTTRGELAPAALHAIAGAQIKAGDVPRRPGWTGYIEAISVMLFGAAAIMIAQRLEFWQAVGVSALLSLILFLGAFSAFSFSNLLINPLAPSLALFVGALSVAGGKSIGGALIDDSVRGSFHDTLPEPAMKKLREEGASEILQGTYRDVTVLACELRILDEDLRKMETLPDDVTKLLAAASLDLRQTIMDTGGAADQADGGRIFAYYNAPIEMADHLQSGCAAALRLVESMDKINADLDASSLTRGLQINLAIGIATGNCFIGPMGHGRHNRYSAIGPAVDRAAYLRSQSEIFGPAMICDEAIYRGTHHHFAFLELDKLKTRGSDRPFSVYALIGNPFIKSSKGFRALDDDQRKLLTAYRAGNASEARAMLDKVKKSPGANIALFDIYEERVKHLETKGAPDGWDGVHQAEI